MDKNKEMAEERIDKEIARRNRNAEKMKTKRAWLRIHPRNESK